jgi:hypothetical protein
MHNEPRRHPSTKHPGFEIESLLLIDTSCARAKSLACALLILSAAYNRRQLPLLPHARMLLKSWNSNRNQVLDFLNCNTHICCLDVDPCQVGCEIEALGIDWTSVGVQCSKQPVQQAAATPTKKPEDLSFAAALQHRPLLSART